MNEDVTDELSMEEEEDQWDDPLADENCVEVDIMPADGDGEGGPARMPMVVGSNADISAIELDGMVYYISPVDAQMIADALVWRQNPDMRDKTHEEMFGA